MRNIDDRGVAQNLVLREKLEREPSARNVWDELERNTRRYDPNQVIEEITGDGFDWYDTNGRLQNFKRSSLDALLSRMRKKLPE